jgi:hypothetical protein
VRLQHPEHALAGIFLSFFTFPAFFISSTAVHNRVLRASKLPERNLRENNLEEEFQNPAFQTRC